MIFTSEEWRVFLDPNKIPIQAGTSRLSPLALKELVDNALDAGNTAKWGLIYDEEYPDARPLGFYVEDDGPGLPGDTPDEIAHLFSISRPFMSSKMIRMPTRGALGNGLRVVSGIAFSSGGGVAVHTNGMYIRMALDESSGITIPVEVSPSSSPGTRIEITIGSRISVYDLLDSYVWADMAIFLAGKGQPYKGKTSAHWYDSGAFYALCKAAPAEVTVRQLIAGDRGYNGFDGCAGRKAGEIAEPFKNVQVRDLTREQTDNLLHRMRRASSPVKPERLGSLGPDACDGEYGKKIGTFTVFDKIDANIPYVVEAWASPSGSPSLLVAVNGTPITSSVSIDHDRKNKYLRIGGCGISDSGYVQRINKIGHPVSLVVNITTPYMPITSAGKSPDFTKMRSDILEAIEKAARKVGRVEKEPDDKKSSIRDIVITNIPQAAKKAGDGLPFSQRQMYYIIRPIVQEQIEKDLEYDYFSTVVTDYENEYGDIPDMYRDPRGILYHPHLHSDIPLGTLALSKYERPGWVFNKVLFIEKEGFVQALKQVQWPEQNDCALITSKGQATRALKDVIDLLADNDEPVQVFCVHDADAAGSIIYRALQEETRSRGRRKIEIINLGLEPWQAVDIGLGVENITSKNRRPVADYVPEKWKTWLQHHRVELNAMSSPQFVDWLDAQMEPYVGKLIPPIKVVEDHLQDLVEERASALVTDRIMKEMEERILKETAEFLQHIQPYVDESIVTIEQAIKDHWYLEDGLEDSWRDVVSTVIDCIIEEYGGRDHQNGDPDAETLKNENSCQPITQDELVHKHPEISTARGIS